MPTLHVTNGDATAGTLRLIVDDRVTITADLLHEGPCPPVEGDAWHDVRARFLASDGYAAYDGVKNGLAECDLAIVDACRRGEAIVLWFEHDLYDQLLLIRTLDLVGRSTGPAPHQTSRATKRVSLICISSFPGIDRFIGLGQLTADQLATLVGTNVPVTAAHFALSTDAWRAFRSADPMELVYIARQLSAAQSVVSEGGPVLRFLGDALLRFLAEFPSIENGLSHTEVLALDALAAGATTAGALFAETQAREAAPFMGDMPFFARLRALASARVPLVSLDAAAGALDLRTCPVDITDAGRDVLACRADHVRLNGIDSWRGGVHLAGSDRSPWRWDAGAETLVS